MMQKKRNTMNLCKFIQNHLFNIFGNIFLQFALYIQKYVIMNKNEQRRIPRIFLLLAVVAKY